jgi:hypothetical protein
MGSRLSAENPVRFSPFIPWCAPSNEIRPFKVRVGRNNMLALSAMSVFGLTEKSILQKAP